VIIRGRGSAHVQMALPNSGDSFWKRGNSTSENWKEESMLSASMMAAGVGTEGSWFTHYLLRRSVDDW
jgi:hypothetical protein